MTKFGDSFKYDVLVALTPSQRLRDCFPSIKNYFSNKKILAATFNHRFYNLADKNFIKNFIDINCVDHLMFSVRPSSNKLFSLQHGNAVAKFCDLSQVFLALQLMGRYGIPAAVVSSDYLDTKGKSLVSYDEIAEQLRDYLTIIRATFPNLDQIEKQFPMLFALEKITHQLKGKLIYLVQKFSASDLADDQDYSVVKINEFESQFFWLGFDHTYTKVPHDKPYPDTKWTQLRDDSVSGEGLFENKLRYCSRCCLPETMEGITFDEVGVCVPCRSSEEKMHIDWEQKRLYLESLINEHRSKDYYDCMLPMSGGKDSMFQAYLLDKVLRVKPLAVTHGQNWYSLEGRYNLENCLQQFDLDHVFFCMNREVINKSAKASLSAIGDACWHCHVGGGTFPIQSAVAWDIKLTCWGESIAERDGRSSYTKQKEASLLYNLEVSARIPAEQMVNSEITSSELSPWFYPPMESLKGSGIRYIHLGDYFFWDEERQVEFVKRNFGWMYTKVENTYKGYKSVECVMSGVHDYANFIKRGIGRSTIHASDDVRRGLLTREEGFELAKEFDTQRPHALDFYLRLTGLSEEEFESTLKQSRSKSVFALKLER